MTVIEEITAPKTNLPNAERRAKGDIQDLGTGVLEERKARSMRKPFLLRDLLDNQLITEAHFAAGMRIAQYQRIATFRLGDVSNHFYRDVITADCDIDEPVITEDLPQVDVINLYFKTMQLLGSVCAKAIHHICVEGKRPPGDLKALFDHLLSSLTLAEHLLLNAIDKELQK